LRVLNISGGDIARCSGTTRQAVHAGSKTTENAARVLISAARLNYEKMETARATYEELGEFLFKPQNFF